MTFRPLPRQEPIIDYLLSHKRCLVWADMGFGKTAAVLSALEQLKLLEEYDKTFPVLILAPLRVVQSVWPVQLKEWNFDLSVSAIVGNPKQRKAAFIKKADLYVMNYENIEWLVGSQTGVLWPYKTIIADESTKLKGFRCGGKATRSRILGRVAFLSERFYGLSGTMTPQGLLDLWGQMWFVDQGKRLGRTFSAYRERWFYTPQYRQFDILPFGHSKKEIMDAVSDRVISLSAKDYFPVEEPIVTNIPVTLPPAVLKTYKEVERDFLSQVESGLILAQSMASKSMKCLQIANGVVKTEDGSWTALHDEKLKALDDIIEEKAGAPLLVVYHFVETLHRLKKRYPQGREMDKKESTIDEWNRGEIPLLFIHPQSAGHGLNLQHGGNNIVVMEHWWNLEQYQQVVERIGPLRQLTAGYNRPVFIYNIVAVKTIDERVIEARNTKASVQDTLMRAVKCINSIEKR